MEKLLLVGAGGLGRVALEHAGKKYKCAFLDDNVTHEVDGTPVIGKISDIQRLFGSYNKLVVTIGNNKLREEICAYANSVGYTFPNIIADSAYISPHAKVGHGCVILNNVVVQNNAFVGDGVILNPGVEVHHDCTVGNYVVIYTNSVIRSLAKVGNRVHIGSTLTIGNEVFVKDDSRIEDGCTILNNNQD